MPKSCTAIGLTAICSATLMAFITAGCSLKSLDYLSGGLGMDGDSGVGGAPGTGSAGQGGLSTAGTGGLGAPGDSNLIGNSGFESGISGWSGFGTSQVASVRDNPHGGMQCLGSIARAESWMGPSYAMTALVVPGQVYEISAWVRISEGTSVVSVSTKTVCPGADAGVPVETYVPLSNAAGTTNWLEIRGSFVAPTCAPTEFRIYFEGPPAMVDLFVDDVAVAAVES